MDIILSLILLISALWVMKDAHNNNLDHPIEWGVATAL